MVGDLRDDGIRIIADALVVGKNTTMDVLCVHYNGISSNGLPHITRILQSTRLKSIRLSGQAIFDDDETGTRDFARVLSRHEFLREIFPIVDLEMRLFVSLLMMRFLATQPWKFWI